MAEERQGIFTPEQEKTLDNLIKFGNPVLEALDGPAISLIDNQGIDRLTDQLKEKSPEAYEITLEIIDIIFEALSALEAKL